MASLELSELSMEQAYFAIGNGGLREVARGKLLSYTG